MLEGLSRNAKDSPIVQRPGTERLVEADSLLVPIEDSPLETRAGARHGQTGEVPQELATHTLTAMLGEHEEIFEVEAGTCLECGVVVKEEREPNGVSAE